MANGTWLDWARLGGVTHLSESWTHWLAIGLVTLFTGYILFWFLHHPLRRSDVIRATFTAITKIHSGRSPNLELGENDIRLLSFAATGSPHAHADSEPPELNLATYLRSAAPPYVALSYVWGDEIGQKTVRVDGKEVLVRANLHAALVRLRGYVRSSKTWPPRRTLVSESSGTRWYSNQLPEATHFWIDALCIDQTNIDERNRQVRIMRDIYADAASVFAWTGELTDTDSAVLDGFYAYLLVPPDLGLWMSEAVISASAEKDTVLEQASDRHMSHERMDGTLLNVVRRLSTARNFTRMWCAHE
ncbi:hypothetical protein LTR95_009888 [Oleoguttula sp. CCFEE 5521]